MQSKREIIWRLVVLLWAILLGGAFIWALFAYFGKDNIVHGRFDLLMPKVQLDKDELDFCTSIKIDNQETYYIVGYEPNATRNTAYHMILYGCGMPGSDKEVWTCGNDVSEPVCNEYMSAEVMYAWTQGLQGLDLPEGVGFKIGRDSDIKYIVLHVHYANVDRFKRVAPDDSGVFLHYTTKPLKKHAGTLMLATQGQIPPHATENMETDCTIDEQKVLYPFAYRTHTHSLGKTVTAYKVRYDNFGVDQWTMLGRRDPLTPQLFYPTTNKEEIFYGDIIAARCVMESHRNNVTEMGTTADKEMCNLYLMYYVENDKTLRMKFCLSPGPPKYYWKSKFRNTPTTDG